MNLCSYTICICLGWQLPNKMVYGVRPSVDEYEKLIQFLCLKALDWEMVENLQEEMKGSGLHLKGMMTGLIRVVKEMEKEVVEVESITAVA